MMATRRTNQLSCRFSPTFGFKTVALRPPERADALLTNGSFPTRRARGLKFDGKMSCAMLAFTRIVKRIKRFFTSAGYLKKTLIRFHFKFSSISLFSVFFFYFILSRIIFRPQELAVEILSKSDGNLHNVSSKSVKELYLNQRTSVIIENLPDVRPPTSTDLNRTLNWLDLWSDDATCNQFDVRLLDDNSIEPRALVSFPGSGNTWLRMLLMGLTGYYIDTVYPGDELFRSKAGSNFELRKDCNCTLLQKTHDFSLFSVLYNKAVFNQSTDIKLNQEAERFHGNGILVIRNPFKALLSYRNFAFGGMAGMAPSSAFSQDPNDAVVQGRKVSTWDQFITRSIATWELLATVWINQLRRGGIVYYEKLRHDTGPQLKQMAKMLGLERVSQDRLDCVLRHNQDNSFKRSESGFKYPENPFTDSQRLLILKSIETVQNALKDRGYEPLPVELYDFYTPLYEYGLTLR